MATDRLDNIVTRPVKFGPVGHCIYCGTTDGKMTDEHIVPYGLAGNSLVLPASSCIPCAEITRDIENDVLRKQMIHIRTALNVKTRNKKDRLTEFKLHQSFSEDGTFEDAASQDAPVQPKDFPWRFHALMMDQAGFLRGVPKFEPLPWKHWSIGPAPTIPTTEKRTVATYVGQINPYTFARFLAKIGHSYAYAYHGSAFAPMLLDLINGKTNGAFRYWIGGDLAVQPPQPGRLHHVSLQKVQRGGSTYLVSVIHLFRLLGTPVFHAVVGRLR